MDFFTVILNIIFYFAIFVLGLFLSIYLYWKYSYTYWSRKGVPHLEPKFPLGNNDCIAEEATSYGIEVADWYNELKKRGHKYGGAWSWQTPALVLTDPDLIRDVLIKDFSNFTDRDFYHNPQHDPKNESLFVVEKDEWKNLRQKLTPTFTTARIKMMFPSVVQCADPMMEIFVERAKDGKDIDLKRLLATFTIDVIGVVAFGLEFESFKGSSFRKMGDVAFKTPFKRMVKLILSRIWPDVAKILGVNNIPEEMTAFFTEVVKNNVAYRRENGISRPDFTQLLIELEDSTKDSEKPFTFEQLVANTILFFVAGFDTSSSTMHFALFELAQQPELQEKIRNEIHLVLKKHNGEFTYESLQEMTYLRQVIDETLRKYPPVYTLSRISSKQYTFHNTNLTIDKGTSILIPAFGLARDPDYYPEPERFDPDRFTNENKAARNPCVYLPFGEGPRQCIGMRFGIMQSSIGLFRILKEFRLKLSPSTKMPLKLQRGVMLIATEEASYVIAEKV